MSQKALWCSRAVRGNNANGGGLRQEALGKLQMLPWEQGTSRTTPCKQLIGGVRLEVLDSTHKPKSRYSSARIR